MFSKEDMSYKVNEAHQNFLIIDGEPEFSKGLLFPHNIIFDGEEMSLPFAMSIMKQLREDTSLLKELKVITRFGANQEHAILSYDCKGILHIPDYETTLSENTIYKGKVIAKTNNSTIITVNGCYGYVDEPNDNELDNIINVAIIRNCRNKFGFSRFSIANSIEDTSISSGVSESIEEFLTKEELAAIEYDNKETIEWVLDNIDGITRKNVNVVREVLHLTYNPNTQSDLARFLSENPQYFAENNFWLGGYRDAETNDAKLIMYDSNDVVLEIQVNESGMWVQEFSHDRIKSNAQYLLNSNVKALVISGCNVILHENSYLCEDNVEIGNKILNQLSVAKDIIPKLKVAIRTLKEKAGVEYLTLKEYLTYQENKEEEYNRNNVVNIVGNEATITTSTSNGKTALFLNIASEVSSLFTEQDEDVCHIEITNNSTKINAELKMNVDKTGYNIEFYNEHLNIDGLRKDGFELRRRAGVRHLTLQKESIDNFVYGEGQSDIFEKLNRGELIPPTPDEGLEFFDSKFVNVEEGNNQPLAIRKAVNNNDIFLIQGPPGTGKTSVIVEIVKQLVINRGEKVLVCSQAHSAVKNIYDRLNNVDERIKIGNIDEEETMIPDDLQEHPEFLKNNELLLKNLETCDSTEEVSKQAENSYTYKSSTKDLFKKRHEYICKYYTANKPNSTIEWIEILSELRKGLIELDDDAKAFNNARHYQGLNVVMGTCIGIGMNTGLQRSGIVFDTVIIDEAGKANLSETTVPMKLGRKYILVGDNKQLPPFMDTEDISGFIEESGNKSLYKKEVEDAISSSLFEDFLEDSKFPTESSILLNYQYRMNPDIGAYISELFYEEALKNGKGTEKQVCKLRSFPSAVTFIDTSSLNREKAYEKGNSKEGWYNPEEISIFKERLFPRLEELIAEDPNISVGIITPYRKQRALLMKEIRGTSLDNSVYTIDSIQGSEFDIVILSLVRAFNTRYGNKTVGFLDDMRRLNVALSRAKKKLIIIGNLDTLCDEKAHSKKESNLSIEPTEVFKKLRLIQDRTAEKTSLDILMHEIKNKRLENGTVFENCTWKWADQYDTSKIYVNFDINGMIHTFPMKTDEIFHSYGVANDTIKVSFLGISENGRAMFKYISNVSISEMVEDGTLSNVKARMIEWVDDEEKEEALFEFEDGSDSTLGIFNRIGQKHILWDLFESKYSGFIPLYIQEGTVSLEKKPYDEFQEIHKKGDRVRIKVIDDVCSMNYYIVKCGDVYGKINKYYKYSLKRNQEVEATIYSIYGQSISFNVM